jgi:hypothetical protein
MLISKDTISLWILSYVIYTGQGSSCSWSYGSWSYNYLCNQCLSPLKLQVWIPIMARCTWYIIMWLAAGGRFSPGTSTNKTDCHDITDILLKMVINTIPPHPPEYLSGFIIFILVVKFYRRRIKCVNDNGPQI